MADPFIDVQFVPGTVISSPWLNGINDSVKDLLVGTGIGTLKVVNSVAAMQALDITQIVDVFVMGYLVAGDLGGGPYYYDAADTTTPANGGSVFTSGTGTGRWKLKQSGWASLGQFGAVGDGVTNDTTRIQACIDAFKGQTVVVDDNHTFLGLMSLNGSSYNNTTLQFNGTLKMVPDGGGVIFGGAWVGVFIKDCSGVTLNPRIDGNRTAMSNREQIFAVGLAGATNVTIPEANISEFQGDGLYVGQSDWLSNSANTSNLTIGTFTAANSVDFGRNAISIISGTNITIQKLFSTNVGGTILGFIEPGGLDIEPDHGYQTCANIYVGYANIVSAGTSGLGVFGKSISGNDANRDWNCFNITIAQADVLKTGTTGSALSATPFLRVADLSVKANYSYNSTRGEGITLDFAQRIRQFDVTISNVTVGLFLGRANTITDFNIDANVSNYQSGAIRPCSVVRGTVNGRVYGAVGGGSPFAVQCHNEGRGVVTQQDVTYSVDAPYDGTNLRAFRNEPGNLVSFGAGMMAQDCDWSGYANQGATNDATIPTSNIRGWNYASAVPSSGTWFFGTFVWNTVPAQAAGKILIGWSRLNTGSNNVLNNDWSSVFATIT